MSRGVVDQKDRPRSGLGRSLVEFLAMLAVGILVCRTFLVEAYVVPTGSMAPTLLGRNQAIRCPGCRFQFPVGIDEIGRSSRPICPNCGMTDLDKAEAIEGGGDRLLVQKFLFDLRPPRRWEPAVFQSPSGTEQAYVKRVVGLPGESIQIRGGDVWIDGVIARKSPAEQKALRLLIYDHDFPGTNSIEIPRWSPRLGDGQAIRTSGWSPLPGGFVHRPVEGEPRIDWLEYRHLRPDRGASGPIHDFNAYNGGDVPAENPVEDLAIEVGFSTASGLTPAGLAVRLGSETEAWILRLPVVERGAIRPAEVFLNGKAFAIHHSPDAALMKPGFHLLEASWFDHRLTASIDDVPLFEPIDLDLAPSGRKRAIAPALGIVGEGAIGVRGLKIYRDVYYTDSLAYSSSRPFGVDEPYRLGKGEFFVLGDNSPVSKDSRFWANTPVVERNRFLGRPFLVHLPSLAVPLRAFGRELYWIPDPREIRYIR